MSYEKPSIHGGIMKHVVQSQDWLFDRPTAPTPNHDGKNAALTLLEVTRRRTITLGRIAFAKALLANGEATADDTWDAFLFGIGEANPVCLGAVPSPFWKAKMIIKNGLMFSKRQENHAREITKWLMVNREAVDGLLAELQKEGV